MTAIEFVAGLPQDNLDALATVGEDLTIAKISDALEAVRAVRKAMASMKPARRRGPGRPVGSKTKKEGANQ